MSTTAGYFSESTLLNIRALASERLMDGRTKRNFEARADVAQIIPKVQTAKIGELVGANKKKDFTLEIEWPNNCAIVVQECEPCALGGPEMSTNTKTYHLEQCESAPFSVDGTKLIDNDFDVQTIIADSLLSADKVLSEYLCRYFLNWLVTNAGISGLPAFPGAIGTVVGNQVQITAANFNIAAVGYMMKALQYDNIDWTNNISGNQLFDAYQNVNFTNGIIPSGIGTTERLNSFPILFDIFNFNAAGWNDRIISLANGSIAFASRSYYGPTPFMVDSSKQVYTMESKFFPGAILEVWMEKVCKDDLTLYNFNVKVHFDFFVNPAGCEEDNNGIIQFVQIP
jgi:hypothetical protein